MLKKLSELNLVTYQRYKGVRLTETGKKMALEIIRHHRLIELYLSEALGYTWDEVHEEADKLEHVISEDFEARISEFLGNPTHDPHGDPIPSVELKLPPAMDLIPLTEIQEQRTGIIKRVRTQDRDELNMLAHLNLVLESLIQVISTDKSGVRISVGGERFLIPTSLANHIWLILVD